MRRTVQILFLILFTLLFFLAVYPLNSFIPVDIFLRLDPLLAAASILASREIFTPLLLSLIVLGLSFFFGPLFLRIHMPAGNTYRFLKKMYSAKKKQRRGKTSRKKY